MATTEELIEKYAFTKERLWSRWQILQDESEQIGAQLVLVDKILRALEDFR